jgi:membrane associated rhomboid family serine protease
MFKSIWEEIRNSFREGNMVTQLMLLNFIVFFAVNLIKFMLWMANHGNGIPMIFNEGLRFICMPAYWKDFLWHPWGLFTSIFLHEDFFHIINNMIFLYLFGNIVSNLIGDRRILPIYLVGGIVGNVLFMLSDFWVHYGSGYALGASGAVMALAGAAVILAPDYRVMLLIFGEVRVKYVVLVMLLLDLVGIANDQNTGGHIAHLGGFFMGVFCMLQLQDGNDLIAPVERLIAKIKSWFVFDRREKSTKRRKKEPVFNKYSSNNDKKGNRASDNALSFQEQLDAILDKIRENGGYDNLTQAEKDFLFDASKRK